MFSSFLQKFAKDSWVGWLVVFVIVLVIEFDFWFFAFPSSSPVKQKLHLCASFPLDTVCLTQLLCPRIHRYSRWAVLVKGRSDFRNQFLQSFLSITSFGFPLLFRIVYQMCFWQPPCYSFLKKWVLVCKELLTLSIPFMRKRRTANKLYCKIHMLNVSWILKEIIL